MSTSAVPALPPIKGATDMEDFSASQDAGGLSLYNNVFGEGHVHAGKEQASTNLNDEAAMIKRAANGAFPLQPETTLTHPPLSLLTDFIPRPAPEDPAFRFRRTSLIFDSNQTRASEVCQQLGAFLATNPFVEVLSAVPEKGAVGLAVFVDGVTFIDVKIRIWVTDLKMLAVEVDLRDGDPMAFVTFYHELRGEVLASKQVKVAEMLSEWNPPMLVSEQAPNEETWRALLASTTCESWIGIACDTPASQLRPLAALLSRAKNVFGQSRSLFGLGKLLTHMSESRENLPFVLKLSAEQLVPKVKQLLEVGRSTSFDSCAAGDTPAVWFSVVCSLLTAHVHLLTATRNVLSEISETHAQQLALDDVVIPMAFNQLQEAKRHEAITKINEVTKLLASFGRLQE